MEIVVTIVVWLVLCALVDKYAASKGRSGFFLLSFLFSPLIGLLIALLISAKPAPRANIPKKQCPYCAEQIQLAAILCPHCRMSLNGKSSSLTPSKTSARSRPNRRFYFAENGTAEGPFTTDEIREFIDAGTVREETPVIQEGEAQWRAIADYPELADA